MTFATVNDTTPANPAMPETVLIVDDEDGVRRTFTEWLTGVPDVRALAAEAIQQHAAGIRPLVSRVAPVRFRPDGVPREAQTRAG